MERLRLATNEDMAVLFEWANDRSVRNLSFCSEPISWETHVEWFQQMMHSQDVIQFIYECDDKMVGQVRLRIHNGAGLISYSIASEYRGNGKATQMLTLRLTPRKLGRHGVLRTVTRSVFTHLWRQLF